MMLFLASLMRIPVSKNNDAFLCNFGPSSRKKEEKHLFFAILSLVLGGKECGKGTT